MSGPLIDTTAINHLRGADPVMATLIDRLGADSLVGDQLVRGPSSPYEMLVRHAKVRYLRALAEHVRDGRLVLEELPELDDDEVLARLTAVPGIGAWSAELFLIFSLERADVIVSGDLGIRRAIMIADGRPELPTPKQVDEHARA